MSQAIARTTTLMVLACLQGCGSGVSTDAPATGGASGSASGGRSGNGGGALTGGIVGTLQTGGTVGTGGRMGTGGTVGTGGGRMGTGGTTGSGGTTGTPGDAGAPADGGGSTSAASQLCVDTINMYRATLGLPPYARWVEQEACTSQAALTDSQTGMAHSSFGDCGENAQNECPNWNGSLESIVAGCLKLMWDEGPGTGPAHGHYNTMSSTRYTRVACGFSTGSNGRTWATQNFR